MAGRERFFASQSAHLDRAYATSAARSVGHSLTCIAEAKRRAERESQTNVTAQIARNKVGVPKLPAEAVAVLEAVRAAASREESGEP